tara:strand:+ start:613 stop:1056 length:444 start_codon:yes stop_codon:yes gene_type:complete
MPSKPQSFNGIIVQFGDPNGTPYSLYATSWSTSGGDRPEIDLTSGSDAYRYTVPGLRSVTKYSFECVIRFDTTAVPSETLTTFRNRLNTWKRQCDEDTITIKIPDGCPDGSQAYNEIFTSSAAWVTGLTFTGSIDNPIGFTIEFTIN